MDNFLLTISIPTFNRYDFLEKNLSVIFSELCGNFTDVEICVLDNTTEYPIPNFIKEYLNKPNFNYFRNPSNIGSDLNIANAYLSGSSKYILTLGDDDYLLPGALKKLLLLLMKNKYNIIVLRPCGFDDNYVTDVPSKKFSVVEYSDCGKFLFQCGQNAAFISALVLNRSVIHNFNPHKFVGTNLIQLGVFLQILSIPGYNLITSNYFVSAKRNNSGGYNKYNVFINNVIFIFESFFDNALPKFYMNIFLKSLVIKFYPQIIYLDVINKSLSDNDIHAIKKLNRIKLYNIYIFPLLFSPRIIVLLFGPFILFVSRVYSKEIYRVFYFLLVKIRKFVKNVY